MDFVGRRVSEDVYRNVMHDLRILGIVWGIPSGLCAGLELILQLAAVLLSLWEVMVLTWWW